MQDTRTLSGERAKPLSGSETVMAPHPDAATNPLKQKKKVVKSTKNPTKKKHRKEKRKTRKKNEKRLHKKLHTKTQKHHSYQTETRRSKVTISKKKHSHF